LKKIGEIFRLQSRAVSQDLYAGRNRDG